MTASDPLNGASPVRALALVLRFLLELALLAGIAVAAWSGTDGVWRWIAASVSVVAVATLWGLLLSPKAAIRIPPLVALLVEAALFVGTAVALVAAGHVIVGVVGVAVWAIDRVVLAISG